VNKKYVLMVGLLLSSVAGAKDININQTVKFHDEKIIQANIKSECVNLGDQFSNSTAAAIQKNGWSVTKQPELDTSSPGINLKLVIINAHSGGNAFLGHSKAVSIEAELYKDGKLINTYSATRNSSGGFGGGFKGSCAVLERCVNTLGKDVNEWLKKQNI